MFKNKKEQTKYWMDYAKKHLVGKTIKAVSWMTGDEAVHLGWEYSRPVVIEFTDGSMIFPSADDEGNDGGALFGQSAGHEDLTFPVNGG
jgi:hypothetical protein